MHLCATINKNGSEKLERKSKINNRSFFDVVSEKLFSLLKNGIFGKFFTSYDEANEKYQQRIKRRKKTVGHSKIRKSASRAIQNSVLVRLMPRLVEWLLRVSIRGYGFMFFFMGAVIAVLYPLNNYVLFLNVTLYMFISAVAVSALSIPLFFSGKSISYVIYNSKICDILLFKFLGLDKEKMRQVSEMPTVSLSNVSFFLGVGLGALSYFVMPLGTLAIIGLIILSYCVLCRPEIGVIVTAIILPFSSVNVLIICVSYVFFCYVTKCILGRRTFKFEYFDVFVVAVLLLTVIRGAVSINPQESIIRALISTCLMLFYFVATNLIRSKEWFRRCLISFVLSGTAVAIIGIAQIIIGKTGINLPSQLQDLLGGQQSIGTFSDVNTFAHYLAAIIPFSIVHFISERSGRKRLSGFLIGAIMIVALCFASSLSGIVGIVSATLLLLMIFNRNFLYLTLSILVMVPVLYFTLPANALETILSIKILEGVSLNSIIAETRTGLEMAFNNPLGIGSGEGVFNTVFQSELGYFDNALLQGWIEFGVIGLAVIVIFGIMLVRLTFSYCLKAKNPYRKINCCVGFCSVAGLVVAGIANYTWHDERIFLMFWMLVALSFSYIRIERENEEPEGLIYDYTMAVLDIVIEDDKHQNEIPSRKYVRLPKGYDSSSQKHSETDEEKSRQKEEFESSSEYEIVSNEITSPLKIEKAE